MIKRNLTHRSLEVGLFINPKFNLTRFDCFDQWSKFKSYGSDFRIGHQAPWSKDFPDPTDNAHHIRSGHHSFEVKPSFLDFFGKVCGYFITSALDSEKILYVLSHPAGLLSRKNYDFWNFGT